MKVEELIGTAKALENQQADYNERECWKSYTAASGEALATCTHDAPWFVIPSDHKWFRNLAISQIILETMEAMGIQVPQPTVDIADIRQKYHETADEGQRARGKKRE